MDQFNLPDLITFLNEQTAETFKGGAVGRYLSKCKMNEDPFVPFIYFREDTFARNLVHKGTHYELLVLTWLPGQVTPIHDHAGQRCWTIVLAGTLTFETYACEENGNPQLTPAKTYDGVPGSPVYLDDEQGFHSMANVSRKPAISLHLYAGPVKTFRVYDPKSKSLKTEVLDYFTTFDGVFGTLPLPEEPSDKLH